MLQAALPFCVSRYFQISHNEHWRSDQQNPDVFLSHGASKSYQAGHENHNMEDLNEMIGFASNPKELGIFSPNVSSKKCLISSKSYTELTFRYCICNVVISI